MSAPRKRDIEEPHEDADGVLHYFLASLADLDWFAKSGLEIDEDDYTAWDWSERHGGAWRAIETLGLIWTDGSGANDTLVLFPTTQEVLKHIELTVIGLGVTAHDLDDVLADAIERDIAAQRGWELQPDETP